MRSATERGPDAPGNWIRRPQRVRLRRAIFQIHLWSGVALGLYVFFISVTGSVLVYRNELYFAATRPPIVSTSDARRLDDAALTAAAEKSWPGSQVTRILRQPDPDRAVEIRLQRDGRHFARLFDPRTGEDAGRVIPLGIVLVSGLIELHDDLLAGSTGRTVNGIGALVVLGMVLTGLVIWWPGIARWRQSLSIRRGVGWRRFVWDLHSVAGFWTAGFTLVLAASGIYLCFPEWFHEVANRVEPATEANAGTRLVDRLLYWLAFLHFGRINGIGLPCDGPGLCDQATKAVWAVFGLAPAFMFVTGSIMWWNRVLRRWLRSLSPGPKR